MSGSVGVAVWRRLLESDAAELLATVAASDPGDVGVLAGLRRRWDQDLIGVAIELTRARRKAAEKFPDPQRLVADVEGVEQATGHGVAEHKARRFQELEVDGIFDLCCGIGGDAMALGAVASVVAVDREPLRAWMTEQNAGCATRVADVADLSLSGAALHVDPSRRGAGRRARRFADYRPSPAVIVPLVEANPDSAVKLGPGVDLDSIPAARGELELITDGRSLVQAVWWSGRLARVPGGRTATQLPSGASISGAPGPVNDVRDGDPERYLVVPDAALERSGLVGALAREHGLAEIAPGLGLLTAAAAPESPWWTSFEVFDVMPWRMARIRDWLLSHGAGVVEVKTRGGAVDPERARRELRCDGAERFTVFGLRIGRRIRAVVTRRL